MNSPDAKRLWWMQLALLTLFIAMGLAFTWQFLPRDHWSGPLFYLMLPLLLGRFCFTRILRRKGLSQESHHVEVWRKEKTVQLPADFCLELRHPQWQLWVFPPMGLLGTMAMLYIYLIVPPDQVIGREWALPLIGLFFFGTWFLWFWLSRPLIRVDSQGIRDPFNRLIVWNEITGCRCEERRDAVGDVVAHRLTVLNSSDKPPSDFSLYEAPTDARLRFCERLRQILGN